MVEKIIYQDAFAEVEGVRREGAQLRFSAETGEFERVLYPALDQARQGELLATAIDWNPYIEVGVQPIEVWRIIGNAVDGKPQHQWLEPLPNEEHRRAELETKMHDGISGIRDFVAEHESGSKLTFDERLERIARAEPVREEIQRGEHER